MNVRRALAAVAAAVVSVGTMVAAGPVPAEAAQRSVVAPSPGAMPSAVPAKTTPAVDDGDVRAIAKVGPTMVIAGGFTSVAGAARTHLAAFSAATGALTPFAPTVDGEVRTVIPGPNDHTVYIGGDFTVVSGTPATYVALVDLDTGAVVPTFTAPPFDYGGVNDLVLRGNRLYLAGFFTRVGYTDHSGLAALDATTGKVDPFMGVQLTGRHNDTGTGAEGWKGPWAFDVTPDGSQMVVTGNFKRADGLVRDQLVQIDLTGTSARVRTDWSTSRYAPYCFNWAFDGYTRGVSYSPDGSYFVVNATGGGVTGTLCDGTARFETRATGADVQPTWVNEAGGDTMWGVTITDSAVFVGGHARWSNNPLGVDKPGAGAVPRPGLAALDPVSGRPLQWNPGRNPPGKAVYTIFATSDGVYVGSNTDFVGDFTYKRPKIAFFPYAGGSTLASTATGTLPGTVFVAGDPNISSSDVLYRVNAGGAQLASLDDGPAWADDSAPTTAYRSAESRTAAWPPIPKVDSTVPASTPPAVFESDRWSMDDNPPLRWSFPVKAGVQVQVRLYFANSYPGTSAPRSRLFHILIDGKRYAKGYDIVATSGDQTGSMKPINVTSDGKVDIELKHGAANNPLVNALELVRRGTSALPQGNPDVLTRVDVTGTAASASAPADAGGIGWGASRGAFMVGPKVFYGMRDGFLYSRTFDGASFGSPTRIDPYHDPVWKDVFNNIAGTFDGTSPTLYSRLPDVTGMFYAGGRLYYTIAGDPALRSRWFSPDSGIVDETTVTAPSSVSFSSAGGMFAVGTTLYYASRTDGTLRKVTFSGGAVTGSPTVVSGPSVDGVNWTNRSLFLFTGTPEAAANTPPTAVLTPQCTDLACGFDGAGSTDAEGTVASYAWDFGDGSNGTGAAPTHTYAAAGTYTVKLTATDDLGATGSTTAQVTVTAPPPNQPPTAALAASCSGGTCQFDGSGSSDPDGKVASYAWDFGDGTTGTGRTATHGYATGGAYTVSLEVTDTAGASDSATHGVTVTVPKSPVAFVGASHSDPNATKVKRADVPEGTKPGDTLVLVFTRNTTSTWTDPAGVSGWTELETTTNGSVTTTVWTKTATAEDTAGGVGVTMDNTRYQKAILNLLAYSGVASVTAAGAGDVGTAEHVTPPLEVPARAWLVSYWADKSSGTESWTAPDGVTTRDTATGTVGAGRFGSLVADSNGPVPQGSHGNLTATTPAPGDRGVTWTIGLEPVDEPAAPPPPAPGNEAPHAVLAADCTGGVCTVDASASTDPEDGSPASFAWDFGDGAGGTGKTAQHAYAAGGTYTVTLTVTDRAGATASAARDVTVTVPANPIAFVGASHSDPEATRVKQVSVPEGTKAGDTMVLVFTKNQTSSWTGPVGVTGWRQVETFTNGTVTTTVWAKTAVAGDVDASVRVRMTNTTYQKAVLNLVVYAGVDADTMTALASGDRGTSSHETPGVQAAAGQWVVSYWADKSRGTTAWTAPSEVTVRDTTAGQRGSGRFASLVADSGGPVEPGPAGGLAATTDATSGRGVMWSLVLGPRR